MSLSVLAVAIVGVALGGLAGWGLRNRRSGPETAAPARAPESDRADESTLGPVAEAVERIEHGVVVVDGDGVEQYRNLAATRLATARHGHALVENCVRRLLAAARDGESQRESVELFGPPAEQFVVTAHPFRDSRGRGAMAVVEDRSAARRTETVRRDFVANISHELKTPVGALGLLAETIAEETDPEVVQRLAQRMVVEADRAARTIDDLLELSRIEFADDAEREPVPVADVVAEAVSRIRTVAEHSEVEIDVDVPGTIVVEGDRRQLTSAVFNLLDNAVKYSPDGGAVEIRAAVEAGPLASVVVQDHGMGIPSRSLDRIFERFYRVDRARSRNTGGTGLGLAIVRHAVSNHGGEVRVDSLEGRGSVFTMLLPCAAPDCTVRPRRTDGGSVPSAREAPDARRNPGDPQEVHTS